MNKTCSILGIMAALVLTFAGCSTDFELNKPEEQTIVYGILDPSQDTNWIKINKSFLGDGDNFAYASIPDCTIHENITATISEIGGASRSWILQEKYVPVDANAGVFYGDSQKVYYFVPNGLDVAAEYKLRVDFEDGRSALEATTPLVSPIVFDQTFRFQMLNGVTFETGPTLLSTNYSTGLDVKWNAVLGGKRYDLKIVYHYTEHYLDGSSPQEKTIEWYQGSKKVLKSTSNEQMKKEILPEQFYVYVGSLPELQDVTNVDKRVMGVMDFILTVSADDFSTYLDVSKPSSGLVQERPSFTNVTNGIGIFSSINRTVFNQIGVSVTNFDRNSTEEMSLGQYTRTLKFCSDSAAYVGENYHCN